MRTAPMRGWRGRLSALLLAGAIASGLASRGASDPVPAAFPNLPKDYLREADNPPDFWVSTEEGVASFLAERVHRGSVVKIGESAGGRPIMAVFYGTARNGKGTTTFSGAVGAGSMRA